jgi:hypothetical protein
VRARGGGQIETDTVRLLVSRAAEAAVAADFADAHGCGAGLHGSEADGSRSLFDGEHVTRETQGIERTT